MAVLTNIPNNTSTRDWRDTVNALIKRIAALEAAGVPVTTPAPAFTTQPSVSPTSGTAGSTLYAATPGTVSNGSVVSRVWLLNGTAISSGITALPASSGTLAYQETASGPGGTTTSTVQVAAVTAATVTPTPAPSFISQPSISPNTGTAGATTFTATAGNVSNGSITARSWTINGTVISTGIAASPASSGTLTYQETATGPGGTTQSTVQQVTVATAAAAAPAFTSQPTVSPSSGTAGTTTYTATPGAVSNGSITSRAWALNGSTISTGLTAAPASAGTLTYQEFATGSGGSASSSVLTRTVSAATLTLTLSPASISIASNAAAGTTISNISNVPAGVTPSVTPNDGRLVIAGDASAGWKVVRGMSAISAGTINFSVSATGATGASGVLTVVGSQTTTPPAASERQAAYATAVPRDQYDAKTSQQRGRTTLKRVLITDECTQFYLTTDNKWVGASGEIANVSAVTIKQIGVILDDGTGASKVGTYGGGASTTRVMAPGETVVKTDLFKASDFGPFTKFLAGQAIWVQLQVEVDNLQPTSYLYYNTNLIGSDYSVRYPAETAVVSPLSASAPAAQTGQFSETVLGVGFTCSALIAVHAGEARGEAGDSIADGTGDQSGQHMLTGFTHSSVNSLGQKPVATIRLARHGTTMVEFIAAGTGDMRKAYLPYVTHFRENWAKNDISDGASVIGSGKNVSVYANKESVWNIAKGLMPVGSRISSILPLPCVDTSTNTPKGGWERGGEADLLRQKVIAAVASGKINRAVDITAVRGSSDPSTDAYFQAKNVALFLSDGVHLSPAGYEVAMPVLRADAINNAANDETVFAAGVTSSDPFNDATSVLVSSRASATGHTWAPPTGSSGALTTTGAGRAFQSTQGFILSSAPLSARQMAVADVVVAAAATPEQGVALRARTDQVTCYFFAYTPATGLGRIIRYIDNSATVLASVAVADPGAAYTVQGEADGPYLRLLIGGVEVATAIDGVLYFGRAGVRSSAAGTISNGRQYDAFRAGNLA
ncbi:hypothetical protein C8J24_2962 [Sphingomonas aerolata]|uniref:Lysophospholipase L1-like esterase n=1 Tax=Sphingomonas aerolata TaxID=185951 RepID=A0A2T4YMX0_9SPHN|nr:SGNH/GDSL hydrolase family protein [Sphingomonas aerolata]PTM44752.1 hypothetical protein C8J24_2962 [Sphingomonas aerolata]